MASLTPSSKELPKARALSWRVVLVDDHPIVRHGVRAALEDERSLQVVGEAESVEQALQMVDREKPDVVITDITLGHGSGLELVKQLRGESSDVKIIVFSVHDEELYAERALRAGADGYVRKSEHSDRLVDAVRTVLSGGTALSPAMTGRLVQQAVRTNSGTPGGVESLSDRELEVFQLIGSGMGTRKIAEQLSISIKTVETHRENIKRKLDVQNASELVRHAVAWVENPA